MVTGSLSIKKTIQVVPGTEVAALFPDTLMFQNVFVHIKGEGEEVLNCWEGFSRLTTAVSLHQMFLGLKRVI